MTPATATARRSPKAPAAPSVELTLIEVSPRELVDNPLNPRRGLGDPKEFADMVASVREQGVIEPLVAFTNAKGKKVLLAGKRRKEAALEAKCKTVPVVMRSAEPSPAEQLEIMLDENGHRDNLHPIEEGNAYVALLELGKSQAEIAKACSRSESHVSKRLAIVKLPDAVLDRFDRGDLTLEAAYELTKLPDEKSQAKIAGQLSPDLIKQSVKTELTKAKHAKVKERLEARAAKEGVQLVSAKQLDNGSVAALAGQRAGYYDTRLAVAVADHAGEWCHGATVRPGKTGYDESAPELIYVCISPTTHEGVATAKNLSGDATVDDITKRAALRAPATRSAGAAYEPPKQSAAEKKKIAALQKQYDAALATAEKRLAHLSAHVRTVSKHTLLPLLEAAIVVGFTGQGYYGDELCTPEITWPLIEADVDSVGDESDEIIMNAGLADDGAQSWLVATALSIAMFERTLFKVPYQRDSFTVTSSTEHPGMWTGSEDPRGLSLYLKWVASTGWELTAVETDVLEACWARWRKFNPEPVNVADLQEGDEIPGTDGAVSMSDEGTGQADDE